MLDTKTIIEKYSYIFELQLFDFILLLYWYDDIATINMVVALLVLIRTNSDDRILKALGANNWSIRKIFLYNASYLISFGLWEWKNSNSVVQKYFE
jgi:lipoprotein-releasing system permease protein